MSIAKAPAVLMILCAAVASGRAQERYTGELAFGDDTLTSGEYADRFSAEAEAGDWILVMMESAVLNPYVILKPPSCPEAGTCEIQLDNDDLESGDTRAVVLTRAGEAGRWAILATSSVPGERGPYSITIGVGEDVGAFSRVANLRLLADEAWSEAGRLQLGDKTLISGEYVDNHAFAGHAGQSIVIEMNSNELNPYLIVFLPDKTQADNDNWEGSLERSRIEMVLPLDGLYRVSATSSEPGETGAYVLEIRSEVPFEKD